MVPVTNEEGALLANMDDDGQEHGNDDGQEHGNDDGQEHVEMHNIIINE